MFFISPKQLGISGACVAVSLPLIWDDGSVLRMVLYGGLVHGSKVPEKVVQGVGGTCTDGQL